MIKIENNIPAPKSVIDPDIQEALSIMEIGNSFFLNFDDSIKRRTFFQNVSVNIRKFRFKNKDKHFKTRELPTGVRVWRVS